ncbi:MAG: hypothetical protein U9R68_02510, partial [Planctomycetota bacterium]|nr:hypothetical protein [Planctomycetota bacterium]
CQKVERIRNMKALRGTLITVSILAVLLIIAIILSGCFGPAARQQTLLPVIADAWANLRPDALAVADPNELRPMDAAVATGDKRALFAAWTTAKPAVLGGIERNAADGYYSDHLAAAKRETVTRLSAAVQTYSGP